MKVLCTGNGLRVKSFSWWSQNARFWSRFLSGEGWGFAQDDPERNPRMVRGGLSGLAQIVGGPPSRDVWESQLRQTLGFLCQFFGWFFLACSFFARIVGGPPSRDVWESQLRQTTQSSANTNSSNIFTTFNRVHLGQKNIFEIQTWQWFVRTQICSSYYLFVVQF